MKRFIKISKVLFILYILLGVFLYFTQDLFIFQSKPIAREKPFHFPGLVFLEHNVSRDDGTNLNYLTFYPKDSVVKGAVIYYHGNKINITRYAPYSKIFTDNNWIVYMQDYPGFGKSTGKKTELQLYKDAQLMYDSVAKYFTPDKIIIYGKSLGTGIASYIASKNKCTRLILETPYYDFTSVYQRFTPIYPTRFLLKYSFPTYKYLEDLQAPICIFHGTNDFIIKHANAEKLKPFLKNQDTFITIEKAHHNNIADFPQYQKTIDSLLK